MPVEVLEVAAEMEEVAADNMAEGALVDNIHLVLSYRDWWIAGGAGSEEDNRHAGVDDVGHCD